jgi:AcrR family transcriptional regulator
MKNESTYPTRIVEVSRTLFFRFGYSRVSVDEIATELCISKKTIYQHFKGKKEILLAILNILKDNLNHDIEQVINDPNLSFTEKLKQNLAIIGVHISSVDRQFLEDMRKSVPEAWKVWEDYKRQAANQHFRTLLDEGLRNGQINPAIDADMAVIVYLGTITSVFDPLFINQLPTDLAQKLPGSPIESFNQIIKILYMGILSKEAVNEFQNNL